MMRDLVHASSAFLGILIRTAIAAKIVITEEKKLAWIISLLNSFVVMIVGVVYLVAKVGTPYWLTLWLTSWGVLVGLTAPEETTRIGLPILCSLQIEAAPVSIVMPEIGIAPLVITADRSVPIYKYCSIVQTSTEIAKKHLVSHKDKSFDNLVIM